MMMTQIGAQSRIRCVQRMALAAVLLLTTACGNSNGLPSADGGSPIAAAGLSLTDSNAAMTQTSDTVWTLAKTGSVNTANAIVTWNITATKGSMVAGHLQITGQITVGNPGTTGATIGNIVVNLQTKSDRTWVSRSADVADASQGDAATTVNIVASASSEDKSTFSENAASGPLRFMDATSNTLFSLVPQVTIAPGTTKTLLFAASFDNNVLNLATDTTTRAEIIVTFGNPKSTPASAPNIDINGNGVIDSDEAYVRSVATRLTLAVPAQTNGNATVTLRDTIEDIATTGTVSFSNAVFNLGVASGTVTVNYNPGLSGGTITNCAHLTGEDQSVTSGGVNFQTVDGIDLTACDTQTIGAPPTCTPGAVGCGWRDGDLITHGQGSWGATPFGSNPAGLLQSSYSTVYPSGLLEVGIPGAAGFSMLWTNVGDLLDFLPAIGTAGPLTTDLLDPNTSAAGVFGGNVTALRLNIDFSDAGITAGTSGLHFGDLTLCGFTTLPVVNGLTVRQYQDVVNTLVGGGSSVVTIPDVDILTVQLNLAFTGGMATVFAQDHLVNGTCP